MEQLYFDSAGSSVDEVVLLSPVVPAFESGFFESIVAVEFGISVGCSVRILKLILLVYSPGFHWLKLFSVSDIICWSDCISSDKSQLFLLEILHPEGLLFLMVQTFDSCSCYFQPVACIIATDYYPIFVPACCNP